MIAIAPHTTATAQRRVDAPRDADGKTLNPPSQTARAIALDDEVDVIDLDAELDHAKRSAGGRSDGGAHTRKDAIGSQASDFRMRPKSHVNGMAGIVERTWNM